MMKKLLVLAMVLAISTMANAAIVNLSLTTSDATTNLAVGSVVNVSLVANQQIWSITKVDFLATGNVITLGSWQNGASGAVNGAVVGDKIDNASAGYNPVAEINTVLYRFAVTVNKSGTISIGDVGLLANPNADPFAEPAEDENYTLGTLGGLNVTVVPEPITVALLGLGGLFIRRRKVA